MKNLDYYLGLPYTVVLRKDEDGDTVARVEELPGCSGHGSTPHEALENLEENRRLWISERIDSGYPVPEPEKPDTLPSGRWVQRVPRSLHRKLISLARRERVSLNQLVTSIVSEGVGARSASHLGMGFEVGDPQDIWEHLELSPSKQLLGGFRFIDVSLPGSEVRWGSSIWSEGFKAPKHMRTRTKIEEFAYVGEEHTTHGEW